MYSSPNLYTSVLKDLPVGNEEYFYTCGSSKLGYSTVQSFKTHPGLIEDVTFFILGDVGQTSNSVNTINELVAYEELLTSKSGGIVSMGDLSYANGESSWQVLVNYLCFRDDFSLSLNIQATNRCGIHLAI